jgi:hypothetical protein
VPFTLTVNAIGEPLATKRKPAQKLDQLDERIGDTLVSGADCLRHDDSGKTDTIVQ